VKFNKYSSPKIRQMIMI